MLILHIILPLARICAYMHTGKAVQIKKERDSMNTTGRSKQEFRFELFVLSKNLEISGI